MQTLIELLLVALITIGYLHEDKFIEFEDKILRSVKSGTSKIR